jgi:ubiquinone/menaquinone biosynthesis C-methylase UbiE
VSRESQTHRYDRYKASSYRAYNFKLPERYDTSIVTRLCRVGVMDDAVLEELGPDLPSLHVLDVGCATGRLLARLAEAGATRLAGSDLAPRILATARRKLEPHGLDVDLRSADAEDALPWPDATFDAVTTTGVFHHFFHPEAALSEMRRVLRDGGRLILVDPCFYTPVRQALNAFLKVWPHDGDYRFYTPAEVAGVLERGGWTRVRWRRLNATFFVVVSVKAGRGEAA